MALVCQCSRKEGWCPIEVFGHSFPSTQYKSAIIFLSPIYQIVQKTARRLLGTIWRVSIERTATAPTSCRLLASPFNRGRVVLRHLRRHNAARVDINPFACILHYVHQGVHADAPPQLVSRARRVRAAPVAGVDDGRYEGPARKALPATFAKTSGLRPTAQLSPFHVFKIVHNRNYICNHAKPSSHIFLFHPVQFRSHHSKQLTQGASHPVQSPPVFQNSSFVLYITAIGT